MIAWDQRIAKRFVRLLARTPLHPNHVTGIGLVLGLGSAALFATGDRTNANIAAGLFLIAIFIDHMDGELARLTGRTSRFGHYFDHAVAAANYVLLFVGIGVGLSSTPLGGWAIALGMAAGVAVAAIFGVRLGVERRHGKDAVVQRVWHGFEVEDTMYIVGPVTWLGLLTPFLFAAGFGAPIAWAIVTFRSHQRRRREEVN